MDHHHKVEHVAEEPDLVASAHLNHCTEIRLDGILAFDPSDEQIENRHAAVEFVQCDLRLFAGLYVVWRNPDVLKGRGIDPRRLFACQEFSDVRHLIEEVTKKK